MYKIKFTYSNDLIVKTETFDKNNKIEQIEDYLYNNEKVISYEFNDLESPFKDKTIYTYNLDSTVSFTEYSIFKATGIESKNQEGKLFYKNKNIIKIEQLESIDFEYDNHSNPLKNILGFNLLLDKLPDYLGAGGVNNCTKISAIDLMPTSIVVYTEYQYTYNEKEYPISANVKRTEDKIITNYTLQYLY